MPRILIGNIKGPQGAQGIQGPQGPVGATGPQGPMPDLINNALATEAGVAALDAAMGKMLQDQLTELNSNSKSDLILLSGNASEFFIIRSGKVRIICFDNLCVPQADNIMICQLEDCDKVNHYINGSLNCWNTRGNAATIYINGKSVCLYTMNADDAACFSGQIVYIAE